jgi:hypothetical protein
MRTRIVCSARAKRRAILLVHFFENNAPPGNASSGQRSCRFPCSVLLSATATEQEALQRARNVPAVLQGPDPLAIEPARPAQQRREPTRADLNGLVTKDLTGRDLDHSQRVRALVGVRPEHDHDPRPHPYRPDA